MKKVQRKKSYLSKKDRIKLKKKLKKETSSRVTKRVIVLLMLDQGFTQTKIASLGIATERTIRNIRKRYDQGGFSSAIYDSERTGQPRKITKAQEEKIAAVVCTNPPDGQARWTLELIREAAAKKKIINAISTESIRIILISREIKPWKHKMWCVPKIDAEFIRCMEDVLEVYERPYDESEPVVCLDEKPIQLLSSFRENLPGRIVRQDYEYKRNGVVNAFCGIEPKAGKHFLLIRERKTFKDFAFFVRDIVAAYPKAKRIHIVMDNLATHKEKALILTFGKRRGRKIWKRIVPHYTPKHASWLNQAEIEISMFSRGCLGKTRVVDIQTLRKKGRAWKRRMNRKKVKINWTFSRRKARSKFKYKTGKN
jgi:transposase